jgi:MFS family permease
MSTEPGTNYSHDPYEAMRLPVFRWYIAQRFFFITAMRMTGTVVMFKLFVLTNSSFLQSLAGLAEAIPAIGLALYSGHIVDKSDKRTLLIKTLLLYSLCSAALLFITYKDTENSLGATLERYAIYAVIFFTGIIRSFSGPTSSSILAQLVPKAQLPNAVSWSSSTWLTASVIGHGSAGFLIVFAGYTGTFIIIITYLLIAVYAMYRIPPTPVLHANTEQRPWESMKEGLRYVFKTKELLGALSLDMFAVLFGGAVAMIPYYSLNILQVGPIGLGWLNAATDIGSFAAILTLTLKPLRKKQGQILLYAVAGYGLCIIIFGLSQVYLLSFLALMASGALDGISVIVRGTLLQLKTPDEMRGRVSSVNSMFINSSNEIGQFESGLASKLMGEVPSVVFGGAMTLLVVIITWIKAPTIRKFQY